MTGTSGGAKIAFPQGKAVFSVQGDGHVLGTFRQVSDCVVEGCGNAVDILLRIEEQVRAKARGDGLGAGGKVHPDIRIAVGTVEGGAAGIDRQVLAGFVLHIEEELGHLDHFFVFKGGQISVENAARQCINSI